MTPKAQALWASVAANGSRFRYPHGSDPDAVGHLGALDSLGIACLAGDVVFLALSTLWYQHIRRELQAELLSPGRGRRRPRISKSDHSAQGTKSHPIVDFFGEGFEMVFRR